MEKVNFPKDSSCLPLNLLCPVLNIFPQCCNEINIELLIRKVNLGEINWGQVDVFVTCLGELLVHRLFIINHWLHETKGLELFGLKSVALKVELPLNFKKRIRLKSWNTRCFYFTRTQEPVFLVYCLSWHLLCHFHVWYWFGKQFLFEGVDQKKKLD